MIIRIDTRGRDFVLPYILRELGEDDSLATTADTAADCAVLLSDATPGDASLEAERTFIADCEASGTPWTVLRTAPVVGTGMTGFPRELALAVYHGTFMHTPDTAVDISVVHATDLARAVMLTLGARCTLTVTDGTVATLDALADALAWRMSQKRVFTARSWLARIFRPSRMIRLAQASAAPAHCRELCERFGYAPTPVTEYLRNHIYDEHSL